MGSHIFFKNFSLESMAYFHNLQEEIKKIPQYRCDLVAGYIHRNDQLNRLNTPPDIISICLLFAFRKVFESIILSAEECQELYEMIGKQRNKCSSNWKLLYRGSRDGYKMED